jgi:hypothetical protein
MLRGEKVYLKEIDPCNIEWMRQQRNDPELRKYFREWKDIGKDQQEKWYKERGNNSHSGHVYFEIHENLPGQNMPLRGWTDYSIQKPSSDLVGCCGLHYIDWRLRSAEFGVFLCTEARGKGLGKEALIMLFDYGFREMNLHKIWAEVYDSNNALDIYTKCLGMKVDGRLRDNQFTDGKYINSTLLSVLEDEWFANKGALNNED